MRKIDGFFLRTASAIREPCGPKGKLPGRAEAIFPIFLLYRPLTFFFSFFYLSSFFHVLRVLSVQSRDPTPQAMLNKIIHNSSFLRILSRHKLFVPLVIHKPIFFFCM
jgi:hypothetical protein